LEDSRNNLYRHTALTRDNQRADRAVAKLGSAGGNVRNRIDVWAARVERNLDVVAAESSIFKSSKITTVLDALDSGKLKSQRGIRRQCMA